MINDPLTVPARPGCGTYLLLGVVSLWAIAWGLGDAAAPWLAEQARALDPAATPDPQAAWTGSLIALGTIAVPVALLAGLTPAARYRAVYRTWLLALGAGGLLRLIRLATPRWTFESTLAQLGLLLLATAGLVGLLAWRGQRLPSSLPASVVVATLVFVPLLLAPWLLLGALGSPDDTALGGLVALGLGGLAGVLLGGYLWPRLAASSSGAGGDVALGGWTAGVALLILGGGVGTGGLPLLLAISLAALGFAAAGVARFAPSGPGSGGALNLPLVLLAGGMVVAPMLLFDAGELNLTLWLTLAALVAGAAAWARRSPATAFGDTAAWLPVAVLVAGAAAGPLLFIDPAELSLLLGPVEMPLWAAVALALAVIVAWVLGGVLWGLSARLAGPPALRRSGPWMAATLVLGVILYLGLGRPGFYGDKLFVILRDQADVSAAASLPDRATRLRTVYTTLTAQATRTQARLQGELDRRAIAYQPYYLVNGLEVADHARLRAWLAAQPEVDRVLSSPHLRPLPVPDQPMTGDRTAPPSDPPWGITAIGADRVWREFGVTGAGIVVGQSDSGVDGAHPALRDGYRGRGGQDAYNWLDPWYGTHSPTDTGGHGTHTLGSIVGQGGIGVAPGATWFGCVNLGRNLANPAYYLTCMQFMLAPYPPGGDPLRDGDPTRAAHVINNSWGCPPEEGCDPTALEPAARALAAAGIFVVAAAGNDGPGCDTVRDPLALYPSVFTVGAVDSSGTVASFSSRGPVTVDGSGRIKPDLLAPGVAVISALPHGTYGELDGTSMAGPHVAGVVALLWSAQPALVGDISATRDLLLRTARPYGPLTANDTCAGDPSGRDTVGAGIVDAYAAVRAALQR